MVSNRYLTLLAVVEEQNFTRAARRLSITQPAVSHHIRQLEEEFGYPLFLRGKMGLILTPRGRSY